MRHPISPLTFHISPQAMRATLFGPLVLDVSVVGISLIILLLPISTAALARDLGVSPGSPWGVLTSIFVHSSWTHLLLNAEGLALFTIFFVLTQIGLPTAVANLRSRLFLWGSLVSAIVANLLWVLLAPNVEAVGSSGVVYAAAGFVLVCSLQNSLPPIWSLSGLRTWTKTRRFFLILPNLAIFAFIFLSAAENPSVFLNVAPGVNVFAHGVAFLSSFTIGLLLGTLPQLSRLRVSLQSPNALKDGSSTLS